MFFVIRKLLSISHAAFFPYKPLRNANYETNDEVRKLRITKNRHNWNWQGYLFPTAITS